MADDFHPVGRDGYQEWLEEAASWVRRIPDGWHRSEEVRTAARELAQVLADKNERAEPYVYEGRVRGAASHSVDGVGMR